MKLNACDIVYGNYLAHFGILGMKWGVRRYQNKDGTLTEAGRKRYYDSESGELNYKKTRKELGQETAEKLLSEERAKYTKELSKLFKQDSASFMEMAKRHEESTKNSTALDMLNDMIYKKSLGFDNEMNFVAKNESQRANLKNVYSTRDKMDKLKDKVNRDPAVKEAYNAWLSNRKSYDNYQKIRNETLQKMGYDKVDEAHRNAMAKLASTALKDIGAKDTEVGRQLVLAATLEWD